MQANNAAERLAQAFQSRNLQSHDHRLTDIDVLTAYGLTLKHRPEAAAPLIHLRLGGDARAWPEARRRVIAITRHLATRQRWPLPVKEQIALAETALRHHIDPTCPHCQGRQYQTIPGTPKLSDRPCPKCRGSGIAPLPKTHFRQLAEILARLERIEEGVYDEMGRRLG